MVNPVLPIETQVPKPPLLWADMRHGSDQDVQCAYYNSHFLLRHTEITRSAFSLVVLSLEAPLWEASLLFEDLRGQGGRNGLISGSCCLCCVP